MYGATAPDSYCEIRRWITDALGLCCCWCFRGSFLKTDGIKNCAKDQDISTVVASARRFRTSSYNSGTNNLL